MMEMVAIQVFAFLLLIFSSFGLETIHLNGVWQILNANNSINIRGSVPGGIYTDLWKNGIIEDPYYRFNDVIYRWVAKDDWTYSREFQVPSSVLSHERILLTCEGLDTIARLSINGRHVGSTKDMFIRYTFDIKGLIKEGQNSIQVSFFSPIEYAKNEAEKFQRTNYQLPLACPHPIQNGECNVHFIRKIQSQFSWDWGPAFPSMGIWKNIRIEAFDSVILRNILVHTINNTDNNPSYPWRVKMQLVCDVSPKLREAFVSVSLGSLQLYYPSVSIIPNKNLQAFINISLLVPKNENIQSWWPNGLGGQHLYPLQVNVTDVASKEVGSGTVNIGFRTVELVQERIQNASGLSFYFKINGVPVFMKGANWIPADSFPERVTAEYTELLLRSAKEANMNCLRVWGGGMYETDEFYQLADQLGILIWQDMMFASSLYPATEEFLSLVRVEIEQQIQRLHHHPSILIWGGNNENEGTLNWLGRTNQVYRRDYLKLYIDTVKAAIDRFDSYRPFVASSQSNGVSTQKEGWIAEDPSSNLYGDVHVYLSGVNSWDWRVYPRPRFASEYGYQSWSSFETLEKVSLSQDWSLFSDFMRSRQHASGKSELTEGVKQHLRWILDKNGREKTGGKSFPYLLYLTQINQAMSIKTETEYYLRSQSEIIESEGRTMGALYWQLNDIWPCASWSSIEYGGKWKMLHYFAVHFFSPWLISPFEHYGSVVVYVVSDSSLKTAVPMTITLLVYNWSSFTPLLSKNITFMQAPQLAQEVFQMEMETLLDMSSKCPNRESCFLYFILWDSDNKPVSTNYLFLSTLYDAKGLAKPDLKVSVLEDDGAFDIEIRSTAIAPFVWLEATNIRGRFSDNGFLLVQPKMKLSFYAWDNISANELSSKLTIISLQNIY